MMNSRVTKKVNKSVNKIKGDDVNQLHIQQSATPFSDSVTFQDGFETQVMDHGGETQVVNLGGDTQVVSFSDEQATVENNDTQLLDDCDTEVVGIDGEESEKTEVVDDTDEFSDDDSGKRGCINSVDSEMTQHMYLSKEVENEQKSKSNCGRSHPHDSGSCRKGFTSIRVASMRASGLTARKMASQGCKSQPKGVLGEGHNDEPETMNRCGVGRSIARKLFAENTAYETKEANDIVNISQGANSTLLHSETELAGLSYIDSQEPGEASQANALDFVENFLKVNMLSDDERDTSKSTGGRSKPVLSSKGTQSLAKKANLINTVGERGIFDWDCNLEDEGGGEFFRKKKEVFFASGGKRQKSFSHPKNYRKVREFGEKKQLDFEEGCCYDPKSVLTNDKSNKKSKYSLGRQLKESKFRKNINSKVNEKSNQGFENGTTEMPSDMGIQESMDIRFDTQMAAEAMEDLCFEVNGTGSMQKGFDKEKVQKKRTWESQKSPTLTSNGVKTRRSKLRTVNQSKEVASVLSQRPAKVRKQCLTVPSKEQKGVNNESKNVNSAPCYVEKRREDRSLKKRNIDDLDPSTPSTDQMSIKKQLIQGDLGTFTPVACRTRQSARDASTDFNEETNMPTGFYIKGKRTNKKIGSHSISRLTRSKAATLTTSLDSSIKRKARASGDVNCSSIPVNGNCQDDTFSCFEGAKANARVQPAASPCTTPSIHVTPAKEASPICMGDEYLKQSCKKSLERSSIVQEIRRLAPIEGELISPIKSTRKRRDMSMVQVVFSRHLDGEIVNHQKKILSRLGASIASSMSEATHFIADEFVRTRNMLEAIAFGKPVVTHLWLDSCGQACCHIDEKNYILRDAKKEKEFGFSLPASLAKARQNPLLQGYRVFITPNTMPSKEIVASLVKAVHGLVVERIGRTALKDDKIPDELLVLSCEKDYEVCLPFLRKGAAIYSSELLLNGIVTQKLEYERHRLFSDNVKRTRSTIWLKNDDNQYKPVAKAK